MRGSPSAVRGPASPVRGSLSLLCAVLVALLVPLGAVCAWASLEVGSTDRYVAAVAPLADDPDVRAAIADRVADGVLDDVDAGPFQGTVERLLGRAVLAFTETGAFRSVWTTANRAAHDSLDRALNDRSGEPVALDLTPVLAAIKRQLADDGLPLADRIPVEAVHVVLLEPGQVDTARTAYRWVRGAAVVLPVLALLLAVASVALAVRRPGAVLRVGAALAAGGVLLLVALPVGRAVAGDRLEPELARAATGAVYDALTGPLLVTGWAVLGAGVLVGAGAWAWGRGWWGRRGAE